jgi:leucine efflux protein
MFGVTDFTAFVVAIIVFLLIPGPGNLALLMSTAKGGVWAGLGATLGVIVGDQVLMWSAVAGVAALLAAHPDALLLMQWVGASYLAVLGARMFLAKAGDAPVIHITPRHYLRQAMVITLLNPKAVLFYMAFFPLFVDPAQQHGLVTYALMATTIAALTLMYGLMVVLIAYYFSERLRASPLFSRVLEKVAGLFLIGFGVKLALSH